MSANRRAIGSASAMAAAVLAANILTASHGVVSWLGLTATAGTWVAGLSLAARDALHEHGGRGWVIAAIGAGAVLSAVLSPRLAFASAVAFGLSELADFAVYAPLRRRGLALASLASNFVGAVADTLIFLVLAGFPLDGTLTQVVVKVVTTTAVVGVMTGCSTWRTRAEVTSS